MHSEQLGTLRSYHTTWTLVTYIDTHGLSTRRLQLQENLGATRKYCRTLGPKCLIDGQLLTVQTRLDAIENSETILEELIPSRNFTNNRRKRAPLEFIGKINKILFGTMDVDDAERIATQIETLGNNTIELTEIVQNQTHIIKSGFEIAQKQIKSLAEILKIEELKINQELISLGEEIHIIKYNQKALQFITQIEENLTELEIDIETLISAILFAKTGQIHPQLLTSKKILNSAEAIARASPNTEFPIQMDAKQIPNLMTLIKLSIFHNGEKLIYVIKIPLLDLSSYKLYQHLSVPMRQTTAISRFAFIKPSIQYTAISNDFENYFNLNTLNECKFIISYYICDQVNPVQNINNDAECEVQLITNPQFNDLDICDIRLKTIRQTYWTRIRNSNAWLYAAPKIENLYVICENQESEIKTIENSGILQMKPSCHARTKTVKLIPSVEITSVIHVNFSHKLVLNITEMVEKSIEAIEFLNITEILTETEMFTQSLESNNINDDLTKTEISLKTVIAKAKEVTRAHRINNRLSTLESILKYLGISAGSILILIGIGWKFSMFGKISSLYKIISCVTKNNAPVERQIDERAIVRYKRPIEVIENPVAPTIGHEEAQILIEPQRQIERRPVYAITYDRNAIP